MRVSVELAPGPFVAAGLGLTLPAGAEPVDGTFVLLLGMSRDVRGWPVVDAGTRRTAFTIPPSLRLPRAGQNMTPIRMAGNFRGESRPTRPYDEKHNQREECTSVGNVHGCLRGMTSHAMTLASVPLVST
jgi:hypothetical protein